MTSKENKQGLFDSLGRASVMGLHMVSGIIVGCLLGYWLDKWFGTYPWCAGVGLIVGIGAGFRNIWLDARILLRQGEQDPTIREILCWQLSVIALSLFFGAVLWPFHPAGAWIFWFGFGALLSAWNFFALIKFVPKVISAGWSKSSLFALLLRTNMRLLFTGILLYMVLVWFKGSISAVLLGLAVLLVGMTAGGLKKALKKPA